MPYAIELLLDDDSSAKVRRIQYGFQKSEINIDEGTTPHVTLSIYQDLQLENFSKELELLAKKIKPFEITFSNIGIFTSEKPVIFLAPKVTPQLLKIHKEFHDYFSKYNNSAWDYYRPDQWVPHCTLCMNLTEDMLKRSIEIIKSISFPIKGRFEKIDILKFSPNEQLVKYKLG